MAPAGMGNRSAVRREVSEPGGAEESTSDVGSESGVNQHGIQTDDAHRQHHGRWTADPETAAKNRRRPGDAADACGAARTNRDPGQCSDAWRGWPRWRAWARW